MIQSRGSRLPVLDCCRLLGVSRASVYRTPVSPSHHEEELIELAGKHPRYGYRRLAVLMGTSKKTMRTRMHRLGIGVARKRSRTRTTFPVPVDAPNLCRPVSSPGELLVSDFTYIPLIQGFAYFAITMDVFTRRVRGWAVSRSMKGSFVAQALQMALNSGNLQPGWIHHSDRGSQYATAHFRGVVEAAGGLTSFSSPASPAENAFAESFFSRFKDELIHLREPRNYRETENEIQSFVDEYNHRRGHSSLGDLSPNNFEKLFAKQLLKMSVS